ncbi:hypothetical protein [Paraburkholderia sp. J8-2]|uniref:hypothetical protein n=1 Tax=Paraburkholderia sp. J8-2 TaxID=2805440 RepID=UPI002AB7055E|nr:hypothetical protein [Paraburkholderia sp. J8-2]
MSTQEIAPGDISHIVTAGLSGDGAAADGQVLQQKTLEELEAERALRDLDEAASMSEGGPRPAASTAAPGEGEPAAEVEDPAATRARLMKKAASQREKGRKALTTQESGVVLVPVRALVGDRVLGSAFERYVGAIDMCAHNLDRYGEMVMGAKYVELRTKLTEMIEEFSRDTKLEHGRVDQMVREAEARNKEEGLPYVVPQILTAAVELDVVFRTPLGFKMFKAISLADKSLEKMSSLEWNDAVDFGEVAKRQFLFKQEIGKIYGFASRTNLGLRRRAAGPAKKNSDSEAAA